MGQRNSRFSDSDVDSCDDELFGGGSSKKTSRKLKSPPSKKRKIMKLKYNNEESDEELEERQYEKLSYELQGSKLKVRNCDWYISDFTQTDLVEKENGFIRSHVFVAGPYNEFQFYFVWHKHVTDEDKIEYGLYVCVLSNLKSSTVYYQCRILNHKQRKCILDKKDSKSPRKNGLRLLACICKDKLLDDEYNKYSFLEDDDCLRLCFKIDVEFKSLESHQYLEKLFDENKVKDVTLVVKGKKFPANKKILATESETFAKLFEKYKTKEIEINDLDPEIMKLMLVYVYTRKVPKLFTHAEKLSKAANKYKLKDLKLMCKKAQM